MYECNSKCILLKFSANFYLYDSDYLQKDKKKKFCVQVTNIKLKSIKQNSKNSKFRHKFDPVVKNEEAGH